MIFNAGRGCQTGHRQGQEFTRQTHATGCSNFSMKSTAPNRSQPKGVYIKTFGCQMNDYDSAKMVEQLRGENYVPVDSPQDAQLILVNTCAIREKAEHKVYSLLGSLGAIKKSRPEVVIGVGGCVSQQRGDEILKRVGSVDMVFGTDNLFELPEMLREVANGHRVVRTGWHDRKRKVANFIPEFRLAAEGLPSAAPTIKAGLVITKGCNNYCTFCVVPYTRGREVSREPDNILAEARALVENGTREITLLGQNVNSYKTGSARFVDLLEQLDAIEGLARIRYTSPHPKDFGEDLADAHARLPKLCEYIHLPVQSGSNRILKAMRRNHGIESYLEKVTMIREKVPQMALSTDIIVGFPGEDSQDFEDTLSLMRQVRYDHLFAFKYSPRSDTPASDYPGQVPEGVRTERLARLFELHEVIRKERGEALIGTKQEVLVEGPHPRDKGAVAGRTRGNKPVTIPGRSAEPGDLVPVTIVALRHQSLVGR